MLSSELMTHHVMLFQHKQIEGGPQICAYINACLLCAEGQFDGRNGFTTCLYSTIERLLSPIYMYVQPYGFGYPNKAS